MYQNKKISRRRFVKQIATLGIASQIPWFISCSSEEHEARETQNYNYPQTILNYLFPSDGNGPGAVDVYADKYIEWYTSLTSIDPLTTNFISDGFAKFDERCVELNGKTFMELSADDQAFFVKAMSKDMWGKRWLSRVLNCIIEALLCHPMYNINPDEMGWNWLNHNPGRPDPKPELMYPQILETIREK